MAQDPSEDEIWSMRSHLQILLLAKTAWLHTFVFSISTAFESKIQWIRRVRRAPRVRAQYAVHLFGASKSKA